MQPQKWLVSRIVVRLPVLLLLVLATAWLSASAFAAPSSSEGRALVVVVDRALTPTKIESVRLAVKRIDYYEGDQIGVVAFAKAASVIVPLAGGKTRGDVISTTDPTNLVAGLEAAHAMLRASSRRVRVVVVATDRKNASGIEAAVAKLRADGITISAVGVDTTNRHALAVIATAGKGRRYSARDAKGVAIAFQTELDRPPPREVRVACALVIDRSLGSKLEAVKELARERLMALAPHDIVAVIGFDSSATMYARPQRAANRMRIAYEISRVTSSAEAPNTDVGLQMAVASLNGINATETHVVLFGTGLSAGLDFVQRTAAKGVTISAVGVREGDRNRLGAIASAGNGELQMTTSPLRMR